MTIDSKSPSHPASPGDAEDARLERSLARSEDRLRALKSMRRMGDEMMILLRAEASGDMLLPLPAVPPARLQRNRVRLARELEKITALERKIENANQRRRGALSALRSGGKLDCSRATHPGGGTRH